MQLYHYTTGINCQLYHYSTSTNYQLSIIASSHRLPIIQSQFTIFTSKLNYNPQLTDLSIFDEKLKKEKSTILPIWTWSKLKESVDLYLKTWL